MDLNDESKDSYEFTWDKASEQGSVLIFSTTKDLVKQVTVEAGTGKNCNISTLVINQLLSKLDIKITRLPPHQKFVRYKPDE